MVGILPKGRNKKSRIAYSWRGGNPAAAITPLWGSKGYLSAIFYMAKRHL